MVTQLMRCRLRASDIIGRYGGEEFLAVLTPTDTGHLAEVAESLRRAVEENPAGEIQARVSIGTAYDVLRDDVEKDLDELIHQADQALLKAKRAGKNRVVSWSPVQGKRQPDLHGTDCSRTL
jgi:diguanylate cyclase (GGDEF)-like protein